MADGIVYMTNSSLTGIGRRKITTSLVAIVIGAASFVPATAQEKATSSRIKEQLSTANPPNEKDDIIVTGIIDSGPSSDVSINPRPELAISSKSASAEAYRFARCAKRADPRLIRQAIEGLPHRYDSEYALDRIIREEQSCYSGLSTSVPMPPPPYYGACNPMTASAGTVCRAFFDRGALIELAISRITPKLSLSDGNLSDPAVIDRFNARTARLNSTRYPQERIGYAVVACMVATHTTDALRLIRSEPGTGRERRLSAILLGHSPRCLGGAKKISTDTRQFRVYVAETIYFFAAAFGGVNSLIPDDAKRGSNWVQDSLIRTKD